MSLIVATNRIDENTLPQASEKPSNFKNFFRSPIEIEPNSEIAVQSVKIQRSGNVVVGNDDFFCHYFGTLPETINDVDSLTCLSRTIKPKEGAYSLSGYEKEIQRALNEQYDDPRTFGGYLVSAHTNASGEELGLEISCVDRGESTSNIIDNAAISAKATFNITTPGVYYESGASDTITPSDGFLFTAGSGSATFTRTATPSVLLSTGEAVGILAGIPFGLNDGEFKVEVASASAQAFIVGLSRPQIQVETYENSQKVNRLRYGGIREIDYNTNPLLNNDYWIMSHDGNENQIRGPYELYDYAFCLDESDNITICERVYDPNKEVSQMQELAYWENGFTGSTGSKLTKAQFYASWDGVEFKGKGDEIELYFKRNGSSVADQVVSSTLNEGPGNSFNPIGSTTYALYPQMNVCEGTLKITKYEGPGITTYKYPTFETGTGFTKYTPGDDCFSNEAVVEVAEERHINVTRTLASNSIDGVVERCDSSDQKLVHGDITDGYVYSNLNSATGVDFVHLFTVNRFTLPNTNDTLTHGQMFPNMGGKLGFRDRAFLISNDTDGYVSGDDTLTIKFTSTSELNKTNIASFIRIPNLTHKSFNGGQSGLSKIIYQLPQFANGGNQYGSLYFEPGEKTYVKLHNPSKMILNMLQVQVVDSHEKELDSLTGDTQIVFHVRQARM